MRMIVCGMRTHRSFPRPRTRLAGLLGPPRFRPSGIELLWPQRENVEPRVVTASSTVSGLSDVGLGAAPMSVPARIIASADIFRRRATVRTSARTASSGPSVFSSARRRSAFAVILRGSPQMWRVVVFGGSQTLKHLKRLADKLCEKTEEPYCTTRGWLRCRLGFALTRSAVMCLRDPGHAPANVAV